MAEEQTGGLALRGDDEVEVGEKVKRGQKPLWYRDLGIHHI